jgi:F-type H+-transporting ATPase subunit a
MVWWEWGWAHLNNTILFTWLVMAGLTLGSWLVTRRLTSSVRLSFAHNLTESVISLLLDQIAEVTRQEPRRFLPFLGTLFLFIAFCNLLTVVPWFSPPTGSLSTTTALALIVMVAVPVYGIADTGLAVYLKNYLSPTPLMLPFNIYASSAGPWPLPSVCSGT